MRMPATASSVRTTSITSTTIEGRTALAHDDSLREAGLMMRITEL